jgi:uncharacterized protein (TIGR03083 family)
MQSNKTEHMAGDPTLDFRNPASRPRMLAALRREADAMLALVSMPEHWRTPTACEGWEVRDMVGHIVDATESYLTGFEVARNGGQPPEPVGIQEMATITNAAALAYRAVARDELLARYRDDVAQQLDELESLSDDEWSTFLVADKYIGPLPAMVVAAGSLGGLTVHAWDIREGLGTPHAIAAESADLLVPFVFLMWSATADTTHVSTPYDICIRTTGPNGGDTRIEVATDGLQIKPDNHTKCAATLEFDPASLLLTAYGRTNTGTVRGDTAVAANFRALFRSI